MPATKKHIAVLCGGQSAEHEVSIESAKNVIAALDKQRYEISVIFITRQGEWFLLDSINIILDNETMQPLKEPFAGKRVIFELGNLNPMAVKMGHSLQSLSFDLIFPLLHGTYGEDGKLQGLLELTHIPYVGSRTLGSALCMDKDITKQLLQQANIPVAPWLTVYRKDISTLQFKEVTKTLGSPIFVKPANTGSSIGISKVKTQEDFTNALQLAQRYDDKIILEQYIAGREIEFAVLGNGQQVEASLPGEIIPKAEFYSYEAKYVDPEGAILSTPAKLPQDIVARIQSIAKKAFSILHCDGMARIDFFVTADGNILLNETNTIPGFTQISQYPTMWAVSGLAYSDLLNRLIELAFVRFERDKGNSPVV